MTRRTDETRRPGECSNMVALVLLFAWVSMVGWAPGQAAPADHRDVPKIAESFKEGKTDALRQMTTADYPAEENPVAKRPYIQKQGQALAILYLADQTGDLSKLDKANRLLMEVARLIPDQDVDRWRHGGPAMLMRIVLRYGDKPKLLYPETRAKLKYGKESDGEVDKDESFLPTSG